MPGFNHKSVFEAYFSPLSADCDSKMFNTHVRKVSFYSFFFFGQMQSQYRKLPPKAHGQRTTLTLWGTDSWSHFNLCTLLKMPPSIPWWTIGLTWISLCCPLPAWSHPCSSTLLIMSPNHMGLCCLATSVETGYHRGVGTDALQDFFSCSNSGHPVAFDVIYNIKY